MKNLVTLIVIVFLTTVTSFSQTSFSWDPNDTIIQNVDPNLYTEMDIHQINLTGDTLELGIEVVYNDIPASWDGMICIQGLCLGSIHPAGFTAQMSPIYDTIYGFTKLTVFPQGGTETGMLRIRVYDVNNPNDGDTCTWIVNSVSTASKDELSDTQIQLFPNPSSEFVEISSNLQFDEITIIDFQGRIVHHRTTAPTNDLTLSIKDLPVGEYFVEVISDAKIINRTKLMRHE